MLNRQTEGLLLIIVAAAGYAIMPILAKVVYADGTLHPMDVVTWRFIFATPLIWILLRVLRVPAPAEPTPRGAMLLLGVLFAAVTACAFFALDRIPASLYTVLLYSYPAMVALISSLMGEPLSVRGWIALGLTLVGVTLTVPLETIGSDAFDGVGILLAVFNAAIYAGYLVISGRALRGRRGVSHVTAWVITGALLPLIVLAPFRGLNLPSVPEAWVGLIAIALFSTVMPLFAMLGGTARLGAARASILSTFEPVVTVLLAVLLLPDTERLTLLQVAGGALILFSVILLQLPALRRARAVPAAAD
ncbi:MAG: EamA family transporter [Chloroflexi bacterium]|jgi:drug/metabolite transporter (DMT)-like permease|nr:hypothetical protein [Anaerolineae bacterium]MCC6566639.1 EamA family transporter [Chloroflexota bacterium]MCO6443690.1 EamA family transporter [Anaerolineae bacterium]MDL1917003.1 hypothetical protein [Anaerolineae bacterium CFX4]GIK27871.1 MAG: hypothetical protein BroJett007_10090 [Chloroflexota bacterium]